jgi:hypothetical protein
VIGNLEFVGATHETLAVVELGDDALKLVGASGAPLVLPDCEPKIGTEVFLFFKRAKDL